MTIYYNYFSAYPFQVLSNMYPCHLVVGELDFNSSEQLFQYYRLNGHPTYQAKVLSANNGFEAKAAAKHCFLKYPDQKKNEVRDKRAMLFALQIKYQQCPIFQQTLQQYKECELVEDATWGDDYWGMVKDEDGNYQGRNLCGKIMMLVRTGSMPIEYPENKMFQKIRENVQLF